MDDAFADHADAIQPHGWLIVCDESAAKVRRHSANLSDLFRRWTPEPFIGAALREILDKHSSRAFASRLLPALSASTPRDDGAVVCRQ